MRMDSKRQIPPTQWPLVILFILISISVILAGIIYYNIQKRALLNEKQLELSAITDLKIKQITQWRLERIGDGGFLGNNLILVNKFSEFIKNPGDKVLKNDILQSLESLTENFDYKNALLLDHDGRVRLSFPDQDSLIGDHLKPLLPDIIKKQEVVLTDLHRASMISFVHLDLIVPLIDHSKNDTLVLGLLALRIDPQKILYPMIQSWPTPSKSAESLLVRKDGTDIVYLNELRHLKNTELLLRKPVSTQKLPAAMAVGGITGTIDAEDYRGVPVVAAMRKIPGVPWYMIAKIDREEVLSTLNKQMTMVIIILVLFILTSGLSFGFLIRNQRVRFYREKYENELDHLALVKHFDYILKFANDIILLFDKNLNIVEANDRALETYMYMRNEFIGLNISKIRAPETLPKLQDQLKTVDENESATFETLHQRKDGSVFAIEISSRVVNIEGSKYYQTIGRDITERKSAEETLKESEEKFRKIFEESPFCMVMTGKDFGIIRANQSFCNMIGYNEEELKSFTFRDFTHPDHIANDEISLLRLIAQEISIYNTDKRYIRKDGSVIWGSTTISILRDNRGEVQLFLAMVEDITSRKKAHSELIVAKERAEEGDRLKTAFLHNVSHEIRTPMNAIIGFSTLLKEQDLSESERNQFVDIIFQSSNQLLSIINDIVDIANVESGQVRINFREMNLNEALRSLNEQFIYKERENNVQIHLTTGLPDEKSIIRTDGTKVIQILSNLINNSLKFTKEGQIDFGYTVKNDFLEFTVKDTGIGISPEHIEKIFNRFYQVDVAGSRQYGGTGLGLSICKAYVELLGGDMKVESESGKGTIFTFTILYVPA
jgi:PAS domain S-box-containing protein